jgi:hypothetical protein
MLVKRRQNSKGEEYYAPISPRKKNIIFHLVFCVCKDTSLNCQPIKNSVMDNQLIHAAMACWKPLSSI